MSRLRVSLFRVGFFLTSPVIVRNRSLKGLALDPLLLLRSDELLAKIPFIHLSARLFSQRNSLVFRSFERLKIPLFPHFVKGEGSGFAFANTPSLKKRGMGGFIMLNCTTIFRNPSSPSHNGGIAFHLIPHLEKLDAGC